MRDNDISNLADRVINAIQPGHLAEDTISALRHFFADGLIVAAFDLVDRGCVIKYTAPWGRTLTRVTGSTGHYIVHASPDLPSFCPCPAFAYGALESSSHSICKHVLAVRLAERLSKCDEHPVSFEDFVSIATPDH